MLQIKNLTITILKDLRVILKDFSYTLNVGDKVALIGEEGNGKSTLLKLIYNDSLIKSYADYTGSIIKNNVKLGYLGQELPACDKDKSILDFCENSPSFYNLSPKELSGIAFRLSLSPDLFFSERAIKTLSGGEKIKLQFARILMENPDALLLDEPSNDIDIDTLSWLENFINTCGLPVLFVSHDETLIENTANVIIHIEQVRKKSVPRYSVKRCTYSRYISERDNEFTKEAQIAGEQLAQYEKQQEKYRRIQSKVVHELNTISRGDPHGGKMLKRKMKAVKSMGKRFQREHENMAEFPDTEKTISVKFTSITPVPTSKTVLDLNLSTLSIGEKLLSRNIKFYVKGGEKICVTGKNGVGKTTLLKRIADMLLPREDINASYMPQDYGDILCGDMTPISFLSVSGSKDEVTKIMSFLGSMNYTKDEMFHTAAGLSGGQKAKLIFLKMVFSRSNVLILDEPTRNFSPLSCAEIRSALKSFTGTIISVSHDRKYISDVCNTVYELTKSGLIKI